MSLFLDHHSAAFSAMILVAGAASGGVRASAEASPGGRHEFVTLHKETTTPRTRSLTAAFKRVRTPPGESQPARRQRKKNECNARWRAVCRLDAEEHARYKEAERARKRSAVPTVAWVQPNFWQPPCEASEASSSSRLREHVQITPQGSRVHSLEHTSPGGTTRTEQYTSPADARSTREQRLGWRSRIAHARMEGRVQCYRTDCMHCGVSRRIGLDGCMMPHSIGPSLGWRERAASGKSEACAEHGWECPGSREYYGPCESASEAWSEEETDED